MLASKNIGVAHPASNTLRSRLSRTRPRQEVDDRSGPGVYVVKCGECDDCYVGETGRCFKTRLREHKDDVRLGRERNAIYNHVHKTNHAIDWSNSGLVYHSNKLSNRLVVESAMIKQTNNFNSMPGTSFIDNHSASTIFTSNPSI